jgi:hypothetical protein
MNIKFSCLKKRYLIIFLLPILLVFGYWVKIQIGINFFDSFSIGSYFPFKYLTNDVIMSPKPGILLEENFDEERIIKIWSNLWMRESGKVTKELSLDGVNASKCLLIKNIGRGSWVYSHRKRVEVKKGDIFYFEGDVNIQGDDLSAYLSVAAFDKDKSAINWNLFKEKVNGTGVWIRVEKQFNISDDVIKYIRFRLVGVGKGDYRFDNIIFRKINQQFPVRKLHKKHVKSAH